MDKNCKHENIIIYDAEGSYEVNIECSNKKCEHLFEAGDIVTITKEQHQLREDVVKAGGDLTEYFDHAWGNVSYHDIDKLKKALTALDEVMK